MEDQPKPTNDGISISSILEQNVVRSPEKFEKVIQSIVIKKRCSYMDAVLIYANENQLETETVAKMLTGHLKKRIAEEATNLRLLKKNVTGGEKGKKDTESSPSLSKLF